ncbi:MAG: helix-turn-helix domain-containing protein [Methylovulum sp.]|nr:helix-turn-helix domain-containing protein [Methylovulum sp.]
MTQNIASLNINNKLINKLSKIMKPIINCKEAAILLQMSAGYISGLAASGDIPAFKLGDDWRFVTDQLISYLAEKAAQQQRQRESVKQQTPKQQPARKKGRPRNAMIDFSKYG